MNVAPQSTPALRALPVALALLLVAVPSLATAQGTQRLERATSLRKEPGGTELAVVDAGASLATGSTRGDWIQVTLEGWIWSPSVARTSREGFDLVVSARGGENLRTGPNGSRVARVAEGMLLDRRAADGRWVRVRLDAREEVLDPRGEKLELALLEFPFIPPEEARARMEAALDAVTLTIVDPAWEEAIPESWKHRMRGKSP